MTQLNSYENNILANLHITMLELYHFLIIAFYMLMGCSVMFYVYNKINGAINKKNKKHNIRTA